MNNIVYHCLFEQSGTFKNEFKKLGYDSYDYDILNDYSETDFTIDLYKEIENCYSNLPSIFDNFSSDKDFLLAFFPCIRFENNIIMHFQGTVKQFKNKDLKSKLLYDLKLQSELSYLYNIITKLVIICIDKNLPLIIENPYSTQHYLSRYWAFKCSYIDFNRSLKGDFYVKPTQYWFLNCQPKNNLVFEPIKNNKILKDINHISSNKRSLISSDYANRFIKEFIIDYN